MTKDDEKHQKKANNWITTKYKILNLFRHLRNTVNTPKY
jgi:hypothetical protein